MKIQSTLYIFIIVNNNNKTKIKKRFLTSAETDGSTITDGTTKQTRARVKRRKWFESKCSSFTFALIILYEK